MNPDIKAKWIGALWSNKYEQGRGMLRDGDCFCSLGVLCDVIAPGGWEHIEVEDHSYWRHGGEDLVLPSSIAAIAELTSSEQERLANLNDFQKLSFSEIADYIEQNL